MLTKRFLYIFAFLVIFSTTTFFLLKSEIQKQKNQETQHKYQNDLAFLNKSFQRDLERSVIAYKSFEKYFLGAEHVPFVIVIPSKD